VISVIKKEHCYDVDSAIRFIIAIETVRRITGRHIRESVKD
jgi:hypothetical protein